ncbi:LrgB family protein [Burkholderiaceae bacterium DAT-1]|nr:LrgB family protein [Burkholderiaceae bacterium DAT-1]
MSTTLLAAISLLATVAVYVLSKRIHARIKRFWAAPILVAPLLLMSLVMLFRIPLPVYQQDTRWLMWMLGPATVAFAIPIYRQRALLRRYPLTITAGVFTGVVLGVGSSWVLGRAFHLPADVASSLLTRSISTPFAISASPAFGGSQELATLFVIVTGIIGMIVGEIWMRWIGVRSSVARGAGLGAAAHAVGTVKARELGQEEGVVSSLTMVLAGIVTTVLAPWLARFIV